MSGHKSAFNNNQNKKYKKLKLKIKVDRKAKTEESYFVLGQN